MSMFLRRLSVGLLCLALYSGAGWLPLVGPAGSSCPGTTTTFDPVNIGSNLTLSNGNLTVTPAAITNFAFSVARTLTSHSTGKFYSEYVVGGGAWNDPTFSASFGVTNATSSLNAKLGNDTNSAAMYSGGGPLTINNANVGSGGSAYVSGNTIDQAVDFTAQKFWYRINNGNWDNNAPDNPATGTGGYSLATMTGGGPFYAAVVDFFDQPNPTWVANFGATTYTNPAPANFCNW